MTFPTRFLLVALSTLTAALILAGCAAGPIQRPGDMDRYTKFEPLPNGFRFIAAVDERYPEGSGEAELTRLDWMQRLTERAGLCPQGFVLTERRPQRGETPIQGSLNHIYYSGVCR